MDGSILVIPFAIAMLAMVVMLLANFVRLDVVKAGKADKSCERVRHTFCGRSKYIHVDGKKVNVSDCKRMIVCGNSMKVYDIADNDCIFVKVYENEEDKVKIDTYPVLVLHIANQDADDAQYKLRKFICYYNGENWEDIYEKNAGRLRLTTREQFVATCSAKYAKMSESGKERLVLSETFDEDGSAVQYSLHPVSAIYGKVLYAQ